MAILHYEYVTTISRSVQKENILLFLNKLIVINILISVVLTTFKVDIAKKKIIDLKSNIYNVIYIKNDDAS
jgi:hypothetical protein